VYSQEKKNKFARQLSGFEPVAVVTIGGFNAVWHHESKVYSSI